jgi:TonB family protein
MIPMTSQTTEKTRPFSRLGAAVIAIVIAIFASSAVAQNPPLSLADLLIGLRSKKVTLPEKNQILTAAVTERGITFVMTPEIEKELAATGADAALIAAIRTKNQPKPVATPTPKPVATPIPTPTPPDFSYFQRRADASLGKGELDAALTDYNKAVEMKNDDPTLYVGRGRTHFSLKSYDLSVKDFDKAIELSPKTAVAFLSRGASYEKLGDVQKALTDYKKAADLDPASEAAKNEVKRLEDEIVKATAKVAPPVEVVKPEFLNLGNLSASTAERMVMPTYSAMAKQSRISGKVTVDVELDVEGNVVSAKAASGHAMLRQSAEDAAKRSKFKPALFNQQPIKAKGVITYNFTL